MEKHTILNELYKDNEIIEDGVKIAKKFINLLNNILQTKFMKFTDGVEDQGIDATYFTEQSESASIFQIKSAKDISNSGFTKSPEIKLHQQKICDFIRKSRKNKDINSSEKINKLSKLIQENKIKTLHVYFVTFKNTDKKCYENPSEINIEGIDVYFWTYDKSNIDDLVSKLWYEKNFHLNVRGQSAKLKISKNKYIKHDDKSITIELNLFKLKEFVKKFIYNLEEKNFIDSLTNSNARDFLGDNKNNKNIQKTITSENFKENHFYHMGIIMVCEKLDFDEKKGIFTITTPSFANGAQTIGTIMSTSSEESKQETKFLMRIIQTDNEHLTKKIVLFSNSQTTISEDMKYGFDEDQQKLFCLLAKYGYFYKNRFFSKSSKKSWEKRIKKINKSFSSLYNPFKNLLKENSIIKPSALAQAMYVIENPDEYGKAYNSLKLFRYDPNCENNSLNPNYNSSSIYKKTFFKLEDNTYNLKKIEEYIVPFLVVNQIINNKNLFKNSKTEFTETKIKLTAGDITKLKLYLTVQWIKKIKKEKQIEDVVPVILKFIKNNSFENKIQKFMINFKKKLEQQPRSEVFKFFWNEGSVTKIAKNTEKKENNYEWTDFFYLKKVNLYDAKARFLVKKNEIPKVEKVEILAGSRVSMNQWNKYNLKYKKIFEKNIRITKKYRTEIKNENNQYIFKKNPFLFKSISGATNFFIPYSVNAYDYWKKNDEKNAKKISLNQYLGRKK